MITIPSTKYTLQYVVCTDTCRSQKGRTERGSKQLARSRRPNFKVSCGGGGWVVAALQAASCTPYIEVFRTPVHTSMTFAALTVCFTWKLLSSTVLPRKILMILGESWGSFFLVMDALYVLSTDLSTVQYGVLQLSLFINSSYYKYTSFDVLQACEGYVEHIFSHAKGKTGYAKNRKNEPLGRRGGFEDTNWLAVLSLT